MKSLFPRRIPLPTLNRFRCLWLALALSIVSGAGLAEPVDFTLPDMDGVENPRVRCAMVRGSVTATSAARGSTPYVASHAL